MGFLVKVALFLGLIVLLIPVDDKTVPAGAANAQPVSAFEAVSAAQAALADLGGFCQRNPDACRTGGQVATTFAYKAKAGAELLYRFIDHRLATGKPDAAPAPLRTAVMQPDATPLPVPQPDTATTGSLARPKPRPARDTLTARDRQAPWQSPIPPDQVPQDQSPQG